MWLRINGVCRWWVDLWLIERRRRKKYVHRKSTHFDPFLSHTYIAPFPLSCLPFCLLWEKQGRREDLHSDDREDGLVGAFTRLLRINNSNNKCKLIILVPLPSSSLALPRLGYFVEFLCGELYVQEQVHGNNNNNNDI